MSSLRFRLVLSCSVLAALAASGFAQKVVPGAGTKITNAGDDFEDAKWQYVLNNPKSSDEDDNNQRLPAGATTNGRWFEGIKRGHPDVVKRVMTPEGGLEGSTGAMLLQTTFSGIPNRVTNKPMQDDFVASTVSRVGGFLHVSKSPSVVSRIYIPPFEKWENRTGNTFGFRIAARGIPTRDTNSEFKNGDGTETYWPGFFIWFNSENVARNIPDSAYMIIRGGPVGQDIRGPAVEPGWWTFGISCSPDGAIHYYAHAGIEDLTDKDHIASHFPYGYKCTHFETFFYNVLSFDNGRTTSTPWVIDDTFVYWNGPDILPGQRAPQIAAPYNPQQQRTTAAPSRPLLRRRSESGVSNR